MPLRPHCPITVHHIFIGGELVTADRAARMEAAGGNADFCAHAKFATISKLGRGVDHHNGAIDLLAE